MVYMSKTKRTKKSPSTINYSLIFAIIITAALALAVYQTVYGNFKLGAKADTNPCSAYTRQRPVSSSGSASGVVASKQTDRFVWNLDGNPLTQKTVVLCTGTAITRQFGGEITYADIKVGDKVDLAGSYAGTVGMQASDTTILPNWLRDTSTSMAQELTSKVATVDPAHNSLVLNAVTMRIAGQLGTYNLNVKYNTSTTKCYAATKNNTKRVIDCKTIAVGQTAQVSGVLEDQTLTMTATQIGVK